MSHIRWLDGEFRLRPAYFKDARESLIARAHEHLPKEQMALLIHAATLDAALLVCGWRTETLGAHRMPSSPREVLESAIDWLHPTHAFNASDQWIMTALAPYVEAGSFFHWREHKEPRRWFFDGQKCHLQEGRPIFVDLPLLPRKGPWKIRPGLAHPDQRAPDGLTLNDRADAAERVLRSYLEDTGLSWSDPDELRYGLMGLLGDLHHLACREGLDFAAALDDADEHFRAEVDGEEASC